MLCFLKSLCDVIWEQIFIFLSKSCYIIDNISSKVLNYELLSAKLLGFLEVRVLILLEEELMELAE